MNKIITIFKTIYKIWEYKITEDEINVYGLCDTHAKTACAVDCHDGSAFWTTIFQKGNRNYEKRNY